MMALVKLHFYSEELTDSTAAYVILPADVREARKYPVLMLLPPLGGDFTQWQRHADLEMLAVEKDCLIICPDIRLSLGMNMVYGLKFYDMLSKEIPRILQAYFSVNLEKQMVCGYKEGAYTAGYLALQQPGQYEKAIMISCGSITDEDIQEDIRYKYIFGEALNPSSLKGFDLKRLLKEKGQLPEISLYYGKQDEYALSASLLAETAAGERRLKTRVMEKRIHWQECYGILQQEVLFK